MERQSLTHEDFVEAGLEDVFDALATQDYLDGGLSLLIRCPRSHITETITPDCIAVDLYAFCEEFAIPHLKRFMEHCSKENITPLHQYAATPVDPTSFPSVPAPLCPTGAQIRCSARSPKQFQHDFVIAALPKSPMPPNLKSAAVKHATALASSGSAGSPKIKQHQNADTFLLLRKNAILEHKVFAPLLSIGPNTDAVLDCFKIGNEAILKLHDLIVTMHSSFNLTKALHVDLAGAPLGNLKKLHPKVILSKEARAVLASQHHQKSKDFKAALDDTWLSIDKAVKMIASSDHKSIQCITNDLYMGCGCALSI
ncbi:uncharacterized protein BJ212DRAFT_1480138 [Suillus subaureus]|uniref:Uncharacterized protein n=1 Tax=Suillus subaureus TaxID=48587 RepID=A0A9P7JEE8_9AGAM|nr:uncharacterized protein BJ212DRAFT_1480138 [Suillus subaureus]KAG1817567.1 hypothetical protein BJ212DRAFT_1480138 [Suillus subaureus]